MLRIKHALVAAAAVALIPACALDAQDEQPTRPTDEAAHAAESDQAVVPDANPASCANGLVCLYQNANFGGAEILLGAGESESDLRDFGFNDQMSSWCNLTDQPVCYYFNINLGGTRVIMNPQTCHATVLSQNNDKASSVGGC